MSGLISTCALASCDVKTCPPSRTGCFSRPPGRYDTKAPEGQTHLVEGLAVVHADDGANHLGHDDHVAQVRAHRIRLLAARGLALGLAQLLNQSQRLALKAALEPAAGVRAGEAPVLKLTGQLQPSRPAQACSWKQRTVSL